MFDLDELEDLDPSPDPEELARQAAETAAEGLKSQAWNVRRKACRELGDMGGAAEPYLETLKELLETDDDFEVRKAARNALKALQDAGVKLQKDSRRTELLLDERQADSSTFSKVSEAPPVAKSPQIHSPPEVPVAPPVAKSPSGATAKIEPAVVQPSSSPQLEPPVTSKASNAANSGEQLDGVMHAPAVTSKASNADPVDRLAALRAVLHGKPIEDKPKEPAKPQEPVVVITVNVVSQKGEQVPFKVKTTTPLQKVIMAYCARFGFDVARVQPSVRGEPVLEDDTADTLNMQEDDHIDVIDPVDGKYAQSPAYYKNRPVIENAPVKLQGDFETARECHDRCRVDADSSDDVSETFTPNSSLVDGDKTRARSCYDEIDRVFELAEEPVDTDWQENHGFAYRDLREQELPPPLEIDAAWTGLVLCFQVSGAVFAMRLNTESAMPYDITSVWEKQWGVQYASRVKFLAQSGSESKFVRPKEDALPERPAVTQVEGPPGVLLSLAAALRRFHGLTPEEVSAKQEEEKQNSAAARSMATKGSARPERLRRPVVNQVREEPGRSDLRLRVANLRRQEAQRKIPDKRQHPGVPRIRPL